MTSCTISLQQRFLIVRTAGRTVGKLFGDTAVTLQTKLPNLRSF